MLEQETLFYTAWLLTHDIEFMHRHREIDPKVMPIGPLRYLVDLAQRNFQQHRTPLTAEVVQIESENDGAPLRRNRTEARMVRRIFADLDTFAVSPDGLPGARDVCGVWLMRRSLRTRIGQAEVQLDRGQLAGAEALLRLPSPTDDRDAPLTLTDAAYALAANRSPKGGVKSGIYDLDRAWRGGIRPGEIGMIAATTGVGKSQMLDAFAAAAIWQGKHVLLYTFELTKLQMISRIFSDLSDGGYVRKEEGLLVIARKPPPRW